MAARATRRATPPAGARRAALALLAAVCVWTAPASAGLVRPAIKGAVGKTGAITSGDVNEGGASLAVSGLWGLEDPRVSAGVMVLADDMGSETGPLLDPNSGQPLGTTEILHRAVYAVAFRMDLAPPAAKGWAPLGSGSWGAYQIVDDVRGDVTNVEFATGFSLAAGVRYGIRTSAALAGVVRYHRVFDERVGRYISFGVEFTWQ